jgi:hypothetical protein
MTSRVQLQKKKIAGRELQGAWLAVNSDFDLEYLSQNSYRLDGRGVGV